MESLFVGAATLLAVIALKQRKAAVPPSARPSSTAVDEGHSTTSSAQGVNVYESAKATAEYLMFHFGSPADVFPYGPSVASPPLDFAERCVGGGW